MTKLYDFCISQESLVTSYVSDLDKAIVVYVNFLRDVACRKLLKSANVLRSYSKNKSGIFLWSTV